MCLETDLNLPQDPTTFITNSDLKRKLAVKTVKTVYQICGQENYIPPRASVSTKFLNLPKNFELPKLGQQRIHTRSLLKKLSFVKTENFPKFRFPLAHSSRSVICTFQTNGSPTRAAANADVFHQNPPKDSNHSRAMKAAESRQAQKFAIRRAKSITAPRRKGAGLVSGART